MNQAWDTIPYYLSARQSFTKIEIGPLFFATPKLVLRCVCACVHVSVPIWLPKIIVPYTTKQLRGKTFVILLNRKSFPIEYFTRLGIH